MRSTYQDHLGFQFVWLERHPVRDPQLMEKYSRVTWGVRHPGEAWDGDWFPERCFTSRWTTRDVDALRVPRIIPAPMATPLEERKNPLPGPSELRCRFCGKIEMIRIDWQRCWTCYAQSETRNFRTYPTVCLACCLKRH